MMIHRRDKCRTVEALTKLLQPDHVTGPDVTETGYLYPTPHLGHSAFEHSGVGPGFKLPILHPSAVLLQPVVQLHNCRQILSGEIALLAESRILRLLFDHLLTGIVPGFASCFRILVPGIHLRFKCDHIVPQGQVQQRLLLQIRLSDSDFSIIHKDQPTVHFRTGDHEIPVCRVVLYHLPVLYTGLFNLLLKSVGCDKLLDDFTVFYRLEISVLPAHRHSDRHIPHVDLKKRVPALIRPDPMSDNDSPEKGILDIVVAAANLDLFTRQKEITTAKLKVTTGHIPICQQQPGFRDRVDSFAHHKSENSVQATDILPLYQNRKRREICRCLRRYGSVCTHTPPVLRTGGSTSRSPG